MTIAINQSGGELGPYQTRVYALSGENGAISDPYVTGVPASSFSWVFSPATGAEKFVSGAAEGIPAWMLPNQWHVNISFRAHCKGRFVDSSALQTALSAIVRSPVDVPPVKLLTSAQVSALAGQIVDITQVDSAAIQGDVDKFTTKAREMRLLLDGGFVGALAASAKAELVAFYATKNAADAMELIFGVSASTLHTAAKAAADILHQQSANSNPSGSSSYTTSSVMYSGGNADAAWAAIRTQLINRFVTNATTGVRSIDAASLVAWLKADAALLNTGGMVTDGSIIANAERDVGVLAGALEPNALGFKSAVGGNTSDAARVTAVATKKAELEALGTKIDSYYSDLMSESTQGIERIITGFLDSIDLTGVLRAEDVVARIVDSRFYVTTWVTEWGEESAPSLPSVMAQMDQNDVAVVTNTATPPTGLNDRRIVGWRLYRSNAGSTSAEFQLVPDLSLMDNRVPASTLSRPAAVRQVYTEFGRSGLEAPSDAEVQYWVTSSPAASYADLRMAMLIAVTGVAAAAPSVMATAVALIGKTAGVANSLTLADGSYNCLRAGLTVFNDVAKGAELSEVLATTTWLPPPANLEGLTSMANGVMVGFFDNVVCFSEAYTPYAWPVEYQITVDFPVLALAALGQTVIVFTRGSNYEISGADPASMSSRVIPGTNVCVSARSVAVSAGGVLFASAEGVCSVDGNGVQVVSKGLFTREDWTKLSPESMGGFVHDGVYYFMFDRTAKLTGSFNGPSTTQTVLNAYADAGFVGGAAPSAERVSHWVALAQQYGWDNYQTRKTLLTMIAAPIIENSYASMEQADAAVAGLTVRATVLLAYEQLSRYGVTAPSESEVDWWVAAQAASAMSNSVLRSTMLAAGRAVNTEKAGIANVDAALGRLNDMVYQRCMAISLATGKMTTTDLTFTAHYVDKLNDRLYLVDGVQVREMFTAPGRRKGYYRTGVTKLDAHAPMSWLQVDSNWTAPVVVRWRGDGEVRHVAVLTDRFPVRLPPGRYLEHELEISTQGQVTRVTLAGSTQELQSA